MLASDPMFLGIDGVESEAERVAIAATIDPIERLRELVAIEEVRGVDDRRRVARRRKAALPGPPLR